jgi:hypothetical protein
VVEVPAVVLEGSVDGGPWLEIPFRYAPYKPERAPRRTAPHQPRLDWQMWFAALGTYQDNPWLLHLIWKLLHGSETAVGLLDADTYPFKSGPPTRVRASLYHYDFTRLSSSWAENIPGTTIINATRGLPEHAHWWARKRVSEYIPEVGVPMIAQMAQQNGWRGEDSASADPCMRTKGGWLCEGVVFMREAGAGLRRFVGVQTELPAVMLAPLWRGASAEIFVDGPLLVISVATILPLLLAQACTSVRSALFDCNIAAATMAHTLARMRGGGVIPYHLLDPHY